MIIAITGPTATGKTARAVELARNLRGEIISADSRQVYRDMDLGTGKDLEEYGEVPYHLINICEAGEKYNLHRYVSDFKKTLHDIESRGRQPIVCGGTGLYLETAISGVMLPEVPENPELRRSLETRTIEELTEILKGYKTLHNTTDVDSVKRAVRAIEIEEYYLQNPIEARQARKEHSTPLDALIIGIDIPREERRKRISQRLHTRLEKGMVKEVQNLLDKGIPAENLLYYGLEYKYLTLYCLNQLSYDEMVRQLEIAIYQFAKRQMTWFRGMEERRGLPIHWIDWTLPMEEKIERIVKLWKG